MSDWDPITSPEQADFIILAGQRSPGLATIVGAGSPRDFDKRRGYGLTGATLIFRGNNLSEFKVLLRLITVQHWVDWYAWAPIVQKPPPGARPRALDIEHPQLAPLGIRSVQIKDVLQAVQTVDGEWTIEIQMIEYHRPQPALQRIDGSDARSTDPVDQQIDQNTARIQQLSQELAAP